jgi:ATP-binding cassette, subfamily B, bacterial IrtB/YbtQ
MRKAGGVMIKTLAVLAKDNKAKLATIFLISVFEAFFSFIPLVVMYFILCDIIDQTFSFEELGVYTAIIAGSALFRVFFSYLGITYSRNNGNVMVKQLRMRIGEHIRKLSLGYFNSKDMGELSAGLLDNVNKIEMITALILPEIISTFSLSLMVAAGLFFVEPKMALATIITMPVSLAVLVYAEKLMGERGKALYASSFQLSSALLEFVSGIKFIKSFNKSQKKLDDLIARMADFREKSLRTEGALSPVMVLAGISIDLGLVMIIMMGTHLLIGGSITGKTFIVFLVVSSRFFDNLKSLSVNYVKVKYLGIAGRNVRRILGEEIPSGNELSEPVCRDIRFEDVHFSYGEKETIKGINRVHFPLYSDQSLEKTAG